MIMMSMIMTLMMKHLCEDLTEPIDAEAAHRLLFASVLVLSRHLYHHHHHHHCHRHHNHYHYFLAVLFILKIIILTVHPFAVSIETETPLVHLDFLGVQVGVTLNRKPYIFVKSPQSYVQTFW